MKNDPVQTHLNNLFTLYELVIEDKHLTIEMKIGYLIAAVRIQRIAGLDHISTPKLIRLLEHKFAQLISRGLYKGK